MRSLLRRLRQTGMREFVYSICVLAVIILYISISFPYFHPFPKITAAANQKILELMGYRATTRSNTLIIDGFNPIEISSECSGIILLIVFAVTIHLLPVLSIRHKVSSLILIPVIFAGNIIRILLSIFAGLLFSKDAMIFFHNSVSQVFMFCWAIGVYIAWLKLSNLFPFDRFNEKLHQMMK